MEALLARAETGTLQEGDYDIIKSLAETIVFLGRAIDEKATAIKRLLRLIFGAADPKTGASGSVINLFAEPRLNHHADLTAGVMGEECAALLREFFAAKRAKV